MVLLLNHQRYTASDNFYQPLGFVLNDIMINFAL